MSAQEVQVVPKHTSLYPRPMSQSLGDDAPPVLFVAGNTKLLASRGIGFCGSRKASEVGISATARLAADLARRGINVVSGYAAGVDSTAHRAALEAGGTTTIVLAEGILNFRSKSVFGDFMEEKRNFVVVSEFMPRARWMAHSAMQRNKTICGLSGAVLLIEAGLEGGTFEAGKSAQEYGVPLFVLDLEEETAAGNSYFLRRGAPALKLRASGDADIEPVIAALEHPKRVPERRKTLFG